MVSVTDLGRGYALAYVEGGLELAITGSQAALDAVDRSFEAEVPEGAKRAVLLATARAYGELLASLCVGIAEPAGLEVSELWARVRFAFELGPAFGEP
jgi:hypothetical protein